MIDLLDINVWLALVFEAHTSHAAAKAWFDALTEQDRCLFCRLTQQGFLRLSTNPKAVGPDVVSLAKAWELYDALLADPRIIFAEEPADVEKSWRHYTSSAAFSTKVWNDAYLAGFARAGGYKLATFDQGITQYPGLDPIVLS